MNRQDAINLVALQCQYQVYPTLSLEDLGAIVDATASAVAWTPSTAYTYGQTVQPTVRNGHLYRAIVAGTSGTVEPTWPPYTAPTEQLGLTRPYWQNAPAVYTNGLVQDGGALTWLECGYDSGILYDVRLATYNAILRKMTKAAADYDVTVDRDQYKRSQVIATLQSLLRLYAPMGIA